MSRLVSYLVEGSGYTELKSTTEEDILVLGKRIRSECRQFLKDVYERSGHRILRRELRQVYDGKAYRIVPRKDRRPKDMPKELHAVLNVEFKKRFGWNVRDGVFTYTQGMAPTAYCNIFVPVGRYRYCYSPAIRDLYVSRFSIKQAWEGQWLDKWIDDQDYTDKGLGSFVKEMLQAREVVFDCKAYYLIHGSVWERLGI